jgi:UDP-glucose 4-epimerase
MVKKIAEVSDKKIKEIKVLNPAVLIASKIPGKIGVLVNKAFGNMTYEQDMSKYPDIDYQLVNLDESIILTEGNTNGK